MTYIPSPTRYDTMAYRRCGKSGLLLPALSLGLWHNFGSITPFRHAAGAFCARHLTTASPISTWRTTMARPTARRSATSAYTCSATGSPTATSWSLSTKAGYDMWPGPYGNWGSRKYLMASLDQSLKRMNRGLCGYLLPPPSRPGNAD